MQVSQRRVGVHLGKLRQRLRGESFSSDPLTIAYLAAGFPAHGRIAEVRGDDGERILMSNTPGDPWVNMAVERDGVADSYGYNVSLKKWSYGKAPKGITREAAKAARAFVGVI